MNTYLKAKRKLEQDPWTRGEYQGQAPVSTKRIRHRRYIDRGDCIVARMHRSDVFTLYPCGKIVFDANGWFDHKTTREFIDEVLPNRFRSLRIAKERVYSVRTLKGWVQVYDGMVLRETQYGLELESHPMMYYKRQCNRVATKAIRNELRPLWDFIELLIRAEAPTPQVFGEHGQLTMLRMDPKSVVAHKEAWVGYAHAVICLAGFRELHRVRKVFLAATAVQERVEVGFYL